MLYQIPVIKLPLVVQEYNDNTRQDYHQVSTMASPLNQLSRTDRYHQMTDLEPARQADVVSQHHHFQIVITSLVLQIPTIKHKLPIVTQSGYKSTLLLSNVTFAPSDLPELTIFDLICVLILMSVLSFVPSVEKPLRDSMIGNDMRVFTQERRSLFARVNLSKAVNGDVVEDSLVPML